MCKSCLILKKEFFNEATKQVEMDLIPAFKEKECNCPCKDMKVYMDIKKWPTDLFL